MFYFFIHLIKEDDSTEELRTYYVQRAVEEIKKNKIILSLNEQHGYKKGKNTQHCVCLESCTDEF